MTLMDGDRPDTKAESGWTLLIYAIILSFVALCLVLIWQQKWYEFWQLFF